MPRINPNSYANANGSNTEQGGSRKILSVSELNRHAKLVLESNLPKLWVEGEISNLAIPSSGHWYFTLKDARAQVRCAMFRGRNRLTKFRPQDGQKVLARADVSLYEGRGDFQLIVDSLEPTGLGDLQRQFEELKAKLSGEGLFDDAYKQDLPTIPQNIGVVTSPTGAAIRDVLSVLDRRFPLVPVTVLPVAVQGANAGAEIARTIDRCNELDMFDVLIVCRGGGSIEDLWAFNEEIVARAIFNSDIPIISAVGHEVDVTIADYVADIRAATPSAAAELCVPDQEELLAWLAQNLNIMSSTILQSVKGERAKIDVLNKRLIHPAKQIEMHAQSLDHLEQRLRHRIKANIQDDAAKLQLLFTQLRAASPYEQTQQLGLQLQYLLKRLQQQAKLAVTQKQQQLQQSAELLNSYSPLKTLERGYSVVRNAHKQVIKQIDDTDIGEKLSIQLSDGSLDCTVDKKKLNQI